jgi:hypothetical protein
MGHLWQRQVVFPPPYSRIHPDCCTPGASVLQLPQNPLHFPSASPASQSRQAREDDENEEDDEDEDDDRSGAHAILHVLAPSPLRPQRSAFASPPRPSSASAQTRAFFDALLALPGSTPGAPRLVYVRDTPTLAPSSAAWYPHLLAAARARRQGTAARAAAHVAHPTVLVFGCTPPLAGAGAGIDEPPAPSIVNLLTAARGAGGSGPAPPRARSGAWGEDDAGDAARAARLRVRLRKWERGGTGALADELPALDAEEGEPAPPRGMVVLGGAGGGLPGALSSLLRGAGGGRRPVEDAGGRFFRSAVLVPRVREAERERACRVARRREINELTMRMGVGAVGGVLSRMEDRPAEETPAAEGAADDATTAAADAPLDAEPSAAARMWDDWGRRLEAWTTVRQIADRALGAALAGGAPAGVLEPTGVAWGAVHAAWAAQRGARDVRKAWAGGAGEKEDVADDAPAVEADELVERVKSDPDLDQHEQRLLGCIVDAGGSPISATSRGR